MIHKCLNCDKDTKNPKFCSCSCSVSYNNKQNPKRHMSKQCCKCSNLVLSNRKYCKDCYITSRFVPNSNITLQQAINMRHHTSSAYALVRTRARTIIQKLGINQCQKCGYSKCVEVCHIKAISKFSKDTLLSTINDPNNLIVLCRNCHWEFDHQ
jgi:hypothetical protein